MNNLTENQQTIINQITNEFKKINDEYRVHEGGLIDLSPIIKELNEDKIRRKEIEVQNITNTNIFLQNVNKDIQRINDDLIKYGLIAFKMYESTIRIATQKEFNKIGPSNVNYYTDIRCIQNANTIYFNSKINNISKNESSYYYQNWSGGYKSLEDLIGTSTFTEHMRDLIVHQNK
jgi:hypothetical protein